MGRTRNRAFVTGALRRRPLWLASWPQCLPGAVATWWQCWRIHLRRSLSFLAPFLRHRVHGLAQASHLAEYRRWWSSLAVLRCLPARRRSTPGLALCRIAGGDAVPVDAPHFWSLAIANEANTLRQAFRCSPVVARPGVPHRGCVRQRGAAGRRRRCCQPRTCRAGVSGLLCRRGRVLCLSGMAAVRRSIAGPPSPRFWLRSCS